MKPDCFQLTRELMSGGAVLEGKPQMYSFTVRRLCQRLPPRLPPGQAAIGLFQIRRLRGAGLQNRSADAGRPPRSTLRDALRHLTRAAGQASAEHNQGE